MKFFVIGKRKESIKPEQFAEYLDLEANWQFNYLEKSLLGSYIL